MSSLKVTFELSAKDIRHFRQLIKQAQVAATHLGEEAVLGAAERLFTRAKAARVPDFVAERVQQLKALVDMVRDPDWKLGPADRKRVLAALAYFSNPVDLIPDNVPGLGFLDDAIMIELVMRELRHEVEAYADFCRFREREKPRGGKVDRAAWLADKRRQLFERIRQRRQRERASPRFIRLFSI
ncbi:MAG TPA: YkvA family protein [Gammaproteobacteria bacterium]|nr:YkvA family protein [Gammaproteobacteria bacterium]